MKKKICILVFFNKSKLNVVNFVKLKTDILVPNLSRLVSQKRKFLWKVPDCQRVTFLNVSLSHTWTTW